MNPVLIKIDQSRLRSAEIVQYHSQIEVEINATAAALNLLKPSFLVYTKILAELKDVFAQDHASTLTTRIRAAARDRSRYLTGLKMGCNAKKYFPDPAVQNAAKALLHHIGIYRKGIRSQSINAKTATLIGLIKDLKTKPALVAALVTTGTNEWIPYLEAANNLVESLYEQRIDEEASATIALPYTLKQKRKELVAAWKIVSGKTAGYYSINDGAAPWGDLVSRLNALTHKYDETLAARAGRSSSGEAPPQLTPSPTPPEGGL